MIKELLESHIAQGMTQREIGQETEVSQTTVRYWLNRHGLKTNHHRHNSRPYEGRYVERVCKHHGLTDFIFEPSKKGYRCKKCRSGKVSRQRRELKARLVEEAGGQCQTCGYNRSIWSLQFHHRDAVTKEYEIGYLIRDRKYLAAKAEAIKCDLLCANCHGEVEEQKWNGTVV